MATHSSILAWKIAWMEEPGRLEFMWSAKLDTATHTNVVSYSDFLNNSKCVYQIFMCIPYMSNVL